MQLLHQTLLNMPKEKRTFVWQIFEGVWQEPGIEGAIAPPLPDGPHHTPQRSHASSVQLYLPPVTNNTCLRLHTCSEQLCQPSEAMHCGRFPTSACVRAAMPNAASSNRHGYAQHAEFLPH